MSLPDELGDFTWFIASVFRERMPVKLQAGTLQGNFVQKFTHTVTVDMKGDQSYGEICEFLGAACDPVRLHQAVL